MRLMDALVQHTEEGRGGLRYAPVSCRQALTR